MLQNSHVTEITRAGVARKHTVRSQRDLVALSLLVKPPARPGRPAAKPTPAR